MKKYLFRNEETWALQHLDLGRNGQSAWNEFLEGLYHIFAWAFNGNVEIISHKQIKLEKQLQRLTSGWRTISIDPCVEGNFNVGVSRIFLPGGKVEIGIGERPGFPTLKEQLATIPKGNYLLIEDDIFSGITIAQIINRMAEAEARVQKVVCGIQVGNPVLDIPLDVIEKYHSEEVTDLNDPRDFLAGAYGGGLVVQYPDSKGLVRVPYVLPFVDSNARSSIPPRNLLEFSKKIWELNIRFWEKFPRVCLRETEVFFFQMLKRWGYTGEETMLSVSKDMLNLLNFPEVDIACQKKGVIFLDLNGTLITPDTGRLTVSPRQLKDAVRQAKDKSWDVGLCSDSPYQALESWGKAYGINGPILAENGRMLNSKPIFNYDFDIQTIRQIVEEWARQQSIPLLPETLAPEFNGKQPAGNNGIAFGANRICSVSIFCYKNGNPDPRLTIKTSEFLATYFHSFSIDSSPQHGFVAIHGIDDFQQIKGQALRAIGWSLYQQGQECWMIGDSTSDRTFSSVLCKMGAVKNAVQISKESADLVAKNAHTEGVIELIRLISG